MNMFVKEGKICFTREEKLTDILFWLLSVWRGFGQVMCPPDIGVSVGIMEEEKRTKEGVSFSKSPSSWVPAAAESLQSCPTLWNPIDGSPPGSPIPGILQARTLEWVVISFSNACKWKVKVKLFSHVRLLATPWTAAHQAPIHGTFQARVLEWVPLSSLPYSRGG